MDRLVKLRKLSQELRSHPDYIFADEMTRQKIDDAIKNKIAQISGSEAEAFADEAQQIYGAEEREIAEANKIAREESGLLRRYVGDVVGGIGRIGPALGKTAALGLTAIPGETGEGLARWLMETSRDLEGKIDVLAPPPDFDFSSAGAAADTVVGNALNMLPAMAATGGTSAAMQGGRVANAAAKLSQGGRASRALSKLIDPQTLATLGIMSAPEVMETATGKDFIGRPVLPENPITVAALSVPHALIETAFGVTPADAARILSGKAITRGLLDSVKRVGDKSGSKAAAKFFIKSLFKGGKDVAKTSFGEGFEEVLQGIDEIAAREFGNNDVTTAANNVIAELGKAETWKDLGKNFVIGSTVGLALSGGQSAVNNISKRIADIEERINDAKTTPEEAQQLAGMKTQLKEQLAALRERESALKSSVLDRITEPAPLMLPDPDTALSTTGTMSDYEAYQQAKKQPPAQAEETFPTTPIGILNKYVELRNKPDTDPIKQAFMQMMAERGLVAPEQMQYPAGPEGDLLRRLDEAEIQQMQPQVAEGTYELPMLPFNSGKKYLPDGSIVQESPNALPQIAPPKAERITLKSGKPFANEKTAKAYQTKNKLQESHQVKQVEGGFVLEPVKVKKMATAPLKPTKAKVEIVDKSGRVADYPTKKLVARGDAARIEKKLTQEKPYVKSEPEINISEPVKPVEQMTDEEWLAGVRFYRSGKIKSAQLPNGKRVILSPGSTQTNFRENDRDFLLGLKPRTKTAQATVKQSEPAAAQKPAEPVKQLSNNVRTLDETGRVNDSLGGINAGDVFRTSSGRITTPYPKQKSQKYSSQWLIDNAIAEAESRGDDYNATIFKNVRVNKNGGLTPADGDSLNMYLFGQQPKVLPPLLRPIEAPKDQPVKQPSIKEPRPVETIQKEIASVEAAKKKVDGQQATPPSVKRERIAKLNKKLDPLYSELERAKADRLKTVETDRKSSESYKNATILRQSDIGDGYSFMAKIGDKYVMVSKNRDYYLIGNASNATKFVSRIEAESAVDTWNENQDWKAKQEQAAPIAFAIVKNDAVVTSGSDPDGNIDSIKKLADEYGGDLYIAPVSAAKPFGNEQLILGRTWEEIQSTQRGKSVPQIVTSKMPEGAKLVYSSKKTDKKPSGVEVFKGDDITFQFPDGRTEGAYVQDATPKTIDGIADQIYVKLDANGALRYLPKSWITKVTPSIMRQNKMDLAATEAKREADTSKPANKIEDFGEVLHGARKHYAAQLSDDLKADVDIAAVPLSKSWPQPNYKKLLDSGLKKEVVSEVRALRETLPSKPRRRGLNAWTEMVSLHREVAADLLSGNRSPGEALSGFGFGDRENIADLKTLYNEVGHDNSLEGAKISFAQHFYKDGVKLEKPVHLFSVGVKGATKSMWGNWPTIDIGYGKTKAEAIADFKEKLPEFLAKKGATTKQRTTQFLVYKRGRGDDAGTYFIAYKTGGKLVELKKGFTTGKEALDYRDANRAELEAILKGKREVKPERRATNQPRVGKTRRTGDVTPQQFTDTFGFRGVQFGNWVEGDRRQVDLNEAYDALIDLADVLGIPPKALSLNGELGLAFGSRGRGGKDAPKAHYESDNVVINLTKKKGAGSLAHEWWHALDNYFGKGTARGMATESAAEYHDSRLIRGREEIKNAFWNLGKTIKNSTNMKKRGEIRDETRSKPYWSTDVEISARSFESFILSKLSDAQISNDYLANIVSEESYQEAAEENDYPYLLKSEIPSVKDAFNALFQTMQSEKTDKGIKLYSVEHLVARYAAQGLKQAAKIVRAGVNILRSGAKTFATWAREMSNRFGKAIHKHLKAMYADLQAFNKRLGKRGMIKIEPWRSPQMVENIQRVSDMARGHGMSIQDASWRATEESFSRQAGTFEPRPGDSDAMQAMGVNPYYYFTGGSEAEENARFKQQQLDAYRDLAEKENVWYGWTPLGRRGGINPSIAVDGMKMLLDGAVKFADWSKAMLNKYAGLADDALRRLYGKINQFLKMNRRGAILNPAWILHKTAAAKRLLRQSDFVWKKDDYRNARLEFVDPTTGYGETVATVRKNSKNQWELVDSNRAFLSLKSARTAVKSAIYEQMKQAEKSTEFFKQRQRDKKGIADKYFAQPTGEELAARKEAEKPKTFAEKIAKLAKSFDKTFFNERQALEDWQRQIFEQAGRKPLDWENIAEQYDTIDGRIEAEIANFKEKSFNQIKKNLVDNKISYDDFNDFLYAMHAKERNDYIREINPEFRAKGVDGSGMSVKEAEEIKARLFAKYGKDTLMNVGEKYWKMHSDLLKVQQNYGMIDNKTREIIDGKYEYYSPLKRIVDEDAPILLDQRATGRRSKAEDLLAFSDAAINTTFRRGEKTRTLNNIAALMIANPNPALYSVNAGKVQARFNDKTGEVEYRLNKATDKNKTIYVKFGGQLGTITIENPELYDAISGGGKDITMLGKVSRALNAPLKLGATAWSISFLPVNLVRDVGLAYAATFIEKDAKTANKILVGVPAAIKAAYDYEAGIDSPGAKMFKEFLLAGGKTGYNPVEDMRRLANKIKSEIDDEIKNNTRHKITKTIKRILDLTESANNIIESGTRFSGYKTIIENGGTKQQAAAFAKNLTVNFNKYGKWGREINAWIAFGNPALQGSKKVLQLLKKAAGTPKGRAAILAMVSLGVVQELINAALSGVDPDDDKAYYEKISASEKDTAFVVMLPGSKESVSIPLPYGLNILPAIGRNTAAMIMGTQRMGQTADNILNAAINAFSPIGQDNRGFVASAVPTAVKPIFDLHTNTKWTGKKIKPDQPAFDAQIPNSKRFYDSNTNKYLIDFFGWLHNFGGGTDYEPAKTPFEISPADVQYLLEYYTSSAGKDVGRVVDIAGKMMSGEEYELKDLPVIRRFYKSVKDYDVNDEYKDNVYLAKNAAKARREKNLNWLRSDRGKAAIKIEAIHKYFKKELDKIDESGKPQKERRELEAKLKKRFNKKARAIMQKNLSKN